MGLFISPDELTSTIKSGLVKYYDSIYYDSNGINVGKNVIFSYIEMVEEETITNVEKTTRLRDLTISKLIDNLDLDQELKVDGEIDEINSMEVIYGDNDGGIFSNVISPKVHTKSIPNTRLHLYFDDSNESGLYRLFDEIKYRIDQMILDLIKSIKVVNLDNMGQVSSIYHKMVYSNRRSPYVYNCGQELPDNYIFKNIKKLNAISPDMLLFVPDNKPIVLSIGDIFYHNSFGSYNSSIYVDINLDLVSDIKDCVMVNLTNEFFKNHP